MDPSPADFVRKICMELLTSQSYFDWLDLRADTCKLQHDAF